MTNVQDLWSEEALLAKARVYVMRAASAEPESGLEQLWSLFALELLARAAVARIHPALLADPQDGAHVLYAFGFGDPKPPRSVPIATVFRRCQVVVPAFTEELKKDGIALMALRNEELHTGGLVLETLRPSVWQPTYYALCQVLLDHLSLKLEDFFSPERAAAARTVLDIQAEDVESEVKQRIADKKRWFESLDDEGRANRRRYDVARMIVSTARARNSVLTSCPSCESDAVLDGEVAGTSDPRVGDDQIERDVRVLPTRFSCPVCELVLNGHAEMFHAGLGDEYSVVDSEDPLEFYGIDPKDYVDIEDLYEPDYGND